MAKVSLYPANPDDVPEDLTEPTSEYKTQTLLVLLALALFFLLYFGLMFFCMVYTLWALFLCPYERRPWPVIKLIAIVLILPVGVLFVYMVKNLFKFERAQKEDR